MVAQLFANYVNAESPQWPGRANRRTEPVNRLRSEMCWLLSKFPCLRRKVGTEYGPFESGEPQWVEARIGGQQC